MLALIDTDTLRVEGYFEETQAQEDSLGDPVTIHLMGEDRALTGRVEGMAGGIEDRERSNGSSLLANVNPTFSWVRFAQRIPVRIKLDHVPGDFRLIVGLMQRSPLTGRRNRANEAPLLESIQAHLRNQSGIQHPDRGQTWSRSKILPRILSAGARTPASGGRT